MLSSISSPPITTTTFLANEGPILKASNKRNLHSKLLTEVKDFFWAFGALKQKFTINLGQNKHRKYGLKDGANNHTMKPQVIPKSI